MVDFNALRSRKGSNLQTMQKKMEQTESGGFDDPRIWKPTRDANNKSQNVIRLLPISAKDLELVEEGKFKAEDLTPMAKIVKHHFQGPKGWFVENSNMTFGEECPIRDYSMPKWKEAKDKNDEALKNKLRPMLPNEEYYVGVQIIKDGTNPANNGKIMLYQFGTTVRKIVEKAGNPEFEGDVAFDPFDPWSGCDLILNLTYEQKKFGGRDAWVPKFDAVKWAPSTPMCGGDEAAIEKIWREQHSLLEFYDRSKFKTYAQLQEKFFKIMGLDGAGNVTSNGATLGRNAEASLAQGIASSAAPAPADAPAPAESPASSAASAPVASAPAAGSADDEMAQFEAMLRGG